MKGPVSGRFSYLRPCQLGSPRAYGSQGHLSSKHWWTLEEKPGWCSQKGLEPSPRQHLPWTVEDRGAFILGSEIPGKDEKGLKRKTDE